MKSSSSIILIALAVADTLVLWIRLPDHFLIELSDISIPEASAILCHSYMFLNGSTVMAANWLIIVFTVFRLISVFSAQKLISIAQKSELM